jgi:GPI inositol-deacylase
MSFAPESIPESATPPTAIPLVDRDEASSDESDVVTNHLKPGPQRNRTHNYNHNVHLLLLLTWLLPLVAPVLAVWVRTLITAGFTTPFDGDHNFLKAAPFLILVDFASWNSEPLFERRK